MSILEHMSPQEWENTAFAASFPKDFIWGAATAAYQVEGAVKEDGRGPSIWDQFSATPGKTAGGDTGDVAIDHYHRYNDDVALIKDLGLGAYRFSVSWPRVLPEGVGTINTAGLDFYDRLVDALLARGISPMGTLYHWDLPLALHEKGGWLNRDTAYAFADYAEVVARRLGDRVTSWQTHNEPWCVAFLGYGTGEHAPGIQDMSLVPTVGHNLLVAHGLAIPRLRSHTQPGVQLGITLNFTPPYAGDTHPATLVALEKAVRHEHWFTDPLFKGAYTEGIFDDFGASPAQIEADDLKIISTPIDFLGVNNYTRTVLQTGEDGVARAVHTVPGSLYTDMHWEVFPQALGDLLVRLTNEYAPPALVVTENGSAFPDEWDGNSDRVHDPLRLGYLQDHLQKVSWAIEQGAPVKGYFAWSLVDNFEWAFGYSKRFGIVYNDYPTQRRIIKDTGLWYATFIRQQHELHNS